MTQEILDVPREAAGERLDRYLARALALPVERVRGLIEGRRVRIRGKACAIQRRLFGGERIELERPPPASSGFAVGPSLAVLYDDEDCLVVAKPAGLPVEPAGPASPSAVGAASRLGRFDVDGRAVPGLPHRLDRDTSGALLLARHDRALAALRGSFQAGAIEKEYLALVSGAPPDQGALDTPYGRDPADPRRFTTRVASARRARLSFSVERRLPGAAWLRVVLDTGRTHQIRVQLAEAGFPVLGDAVYGVSSEVIARQALHADRLTFPRPGDGARVEVRAPLPEDLARAMEALARSG
ncbi:MULTISPECIES: RluA family pseudouridine synthase [Anaeromyxobacter]|uniref:RluA family pseudouridine synthase n=1 Tax=Anaeromyxobacter TaxID=161492 RepID=UPI001F5A0128|nr:MULTISPECIES: RluA family pseudouridine synthase [unclassified Anaeromyxobacter]